MTGFSMNTVTEKMEQFFIYFLLLQPLLDVLAYAQVPVSTVVRALAMVIGIIYLLIHPHMKHKKMVIGYFSMLGVVLALHIILNVIIKTPYNLVPEMIYIVKTIFFIEMLIVYLYVMRSFSAKSNWQTMIQRIITINMVFIAIVMLVATLTGTGHKSYNAPAKQGHSGWFFSANELSIILGMGFSILILYMVQKQSLQRKLLILPTAALVIWAMLIVGTKVGYGSVLLVLGTAVLVVVINAIRNNRHWKNVVIMSGLLAVTVLVTPSTPVGHNLNISFGIDIASIGQDSTSEKVNPDTNNPISQRMLSGRKEFLAQIQSDYREAPLSQKLFGMGIGGNYTDSPKLIEMDVWDWFFSYGLAGFTVLMLPLIYAGIQIIPGLFRNHLKHMHPPAILTAVSVCLGLGAALLAGHVLSSPAASIYLAVYIACLFAMTNKNPTNSAK